MPEKAKRTATLKRLLKMIKKYYPAVLLSLAFSAGSVVLSLYIPILAGRAIDYIIAPGRVSFNEIKAILGRIAAFAAVSAVLQWISSILNNRVTYRTIQDIRTTAFARLQQLPMSYVDTNPQGDIVSRIITDADQFADGLLLGFSQLFTGVLNIAVTLVFMLLLNPLITLAVVALTPLSLIAARFIARHTYNMFRLQSETRGEQTAFINEMIKGQTIVRAFCREDKTLERFDEIAARLEKHSVKAVFFSSLTNPCTRFINGVVYAAVGLFGAFSAVSGGITVGGLSSFLSYANQYTKPFNEISGVVTELQNSLACAARLFELIDTPAETPDIENTAQPDRINGNVGLCSVNFSYIPDRRLIENFNLSVSQGQRIAIVGPTGCGKTTIINLLMRFYDVNSGKITVDGTDIRQMSRRRLRSSYGMVLQETWLKSGTVRENIKFGRPDATDAEMIEAAKAAHAHSFIKRLEDGYDTYLGENGDGLSEGQKQLLCIARVMLCRPPILILDEATSSIDTRTELKVQDAFSKLMKGRTSFVVAHRLSTIRDADVILVMRDGKIIEQGSHNELLEKGGFYKTLYESQFAG